MASFQSHVAILPCETQKIKNSKNLHISGLPFTVHKIRKLKGSTCVLSSGVKLNAVVPSFGTHTRTKTFAPLIYCFIDHAFLQGTRQTQHALLQFINVMNFRLVDPLFHLSPNSVVNQAHI